MGVRLLALALLLVPAVSAQGDGDAASTPTTLYVHVLDAQNDAPMNTQEPAEDFTVRARVGLATNSLCFENDAQPLLYKEYHTVYGFASPGLVDYEYLTHGMPRINPSRGVAYDLALDPGVKPTFHWYVAVTSGLSGQAGLVDQAPLVVPGVVLRVTMREGDGFVPDHEEYRTGRIIMQGESRPATLAGDQTEGAEHTFVDGVHVYHLSTSMAIADPPVIPVATGYIVQVEVLTENPVCSEEGDYIMPNLVDIYSGPDLRPRLEFAITEPVRLDPLDAAVVGEDVLVSMVATSAWGRYDLANLTVVLEQDERRWFALKAPIPAYHCHCYGAYPEAEAWIFEDVAAELNGGPATVSVHATTLQGYEGNTSTQVFAAPGMESPGVPVGWLCVALLALAVLRAGRR